MTTAEKIRRDTETLKQSVRETIKEKSRGVPGTDQHLAWCLKELRDLARQLEKEMERGHDQPEQEESDIGGARK